MVWKLFNASPNTSPFCNLSFKVTLIRPFIIFQYSANISHFQIHHASSPFTPAPRTVTSADMALAEVTGDLIFCGTPKMSDSTYPKSTCIFQFLCAYRCTRHKLLLGFAATCASFSLFNRKPRLCFFDLPTRFSTSNRLQQGRMRTLPHPKKGSASGTGANKPNNH